MKRVLLIVAVVTFCGLVTAGAFWLLDLAIGDMPHPAWGFVLGAAAALASYARTGWEDRRRRRRA